MASQVILAFLSLMTTGLANATANNEHKLDRQCRAAVAESWPEWRFANLSIEVREWAKSRRQNPTVAHGDFDDDGRKDVALLIQAVPRSRSIKIVACLSGGGAKKPVVIDKPYCSDGIAPVPKGTLYYDFSSRLESTYRSDGIHAYCFEKAGATYVFSNGSFQEVVDSD